MRSINSKYSYSAVLCAAILAASPLSAQTIEPPPSLPQVAPIPETPIARALTRLDELEAQIRALTDRVERAEAEAASQKAENVRLARLIDENRANTLPQTASTETPAPAPIAEAATSAAATTQIAPNVAEVAGSAVAAPPAPTLAAAEPAPIVAAPSQTPSQASPPAPSTPPKTAPVLLAEARLFLQRSEYRNAEGRLTTLTETYPDASESLEGLWLLGEARFVQKAYNAAALSYVAYLEKAPTGPRVSDSLVRLASSFREIGDNRQRCMALREYQRRTPNPTATQRARADAEQAKGACN